eukprot:Stramenopile-MAST_4_protein_3777
MTATNSLRTKLNALANIANSGSDAGTLGVQVSREAYSPTTNEGYVFSVTFQGSRVMGTVPLLTVASNSLGGQSTTDGTPTITVAQVGNGHRSGFKLTYSGQTTSCIPWDAGDNAEVGIDARMEALSTVTTITNVTKSAISDGHAYTIVFGSPATPIDITIDSIISGCDAMPSNVNHDTVVSLVTTSGLGDGMVSVNVFCSIYCAFGQPGTGYSETIEFNSFQGDMAQTDSLQYRINALVGGSDGVVVTRSQPNINTDEGYVFSVTFSGHRMNGNIPQLTLHSAPSVVATTDGQTASSVTFATVIEGATGGFKLHYAKTGGETFCIPWDALASDTTFTNTYDATVEDRLEQMTEFAHGLTVTRASTSGGHRYTVTFDNGQRYQGGKKVGALSIITATGCEAFSTGTPNLSVDKDGNGIGSYPSESFTVTFNTSGSGYGDSNFCPLCLASGATLTTNAIDWSVSTGDMASNLASLQNRLNDLANIDGVVVTADDTYDDWWSEGKIWRITFGSANDPNYINNGNMPLLSLGTDGLADQTVSEPGVSSTDRIIFETIQEGRYGAFRYLYGSSYSRCIPWDAPADTGAGNMRDMLLAMPELNALAVVRSGTAAAYTWTISFGTPATPMSLVLDYPADICGGTYTCHGGSLCDGQSELKHTPFNLAGTFKLLFNTTPVLSEGNCSLCTSKSIASGTSNGISVDASATTMESALGLLLTIGAGNVTVTKTSPFNANVSSVWEGYEFTVTFSGVAVQSDVPLLVMAEDSLTGDEYGTWDTVPLITEHTKGNHFGFKLDFGAGKTSYCIGWDSPNSEFEYGDLRSWEKNLARSPLLNTHIANAIVEKDDLSLLWTFTFEDHDYPLGDIRRSNPTVTPSIFLDDLECDHDAGEITFSSIVPTGLSGNLSRIDLVGELPVYERIYVGDQLSISTSFASPAGETNVFTVVKVINATRFVVDPPLSVLTDNAFTIKKLIPAQRAVIIKEPCGKASVCTDLKYQMDRNLRKVTSVALRNIYGGTTEAIECSGRGICNYTSGLCKCFHGYGKADCSFKIFSQQ